MKNLRCHLVFIFSISIIFISKSCTGKREALGPDNEIRIICSNSDKKILKDLLNSVFDDTLFTPEPEPYYYFKFSTPEKFSKLKNQAYLIVASLSREDDNEASQLIKKLLPSHQYHANKDQQPIYMTRDTYSRNQILMIINGLSVDHVKKFIKEKEEWIKKQFLGQYQVRQKNYILDTNVKNSVENLISAKNDWNLSVPWGWEIINNSTDSGFVWIGKEMPFQWISVSWDSGSFVSNQLIAGRSIWNMPEKNYKNIRFNDYKFNLTKTKFLSYDAWFMEGIWETINELESKGGPFRSYLFYDKIKNKTYHINMLIFHPGNNKSLYMRQMDMIVKSFSLINS